MTFRPPCDDLGCASYLRGRVPTRKREDQPVERA